MRPNSYATRDKRDAFHNSNRRAVRHLRAMLALRDAMQAASI